MKCKLLIIIPLIFYSCNKFDSNVKNHFNKYILIEKYKDYEIESIKIYDTLTSKKNEINKLNVKLKNLKNNIVSLSNGIIYNSRQIQEIKIANIKTKSAIINGEIFTYKVYSIPNNIFAPSYSKGKSIDIQEKRNEIKYFTKNIKKFQNKINNLNNKKDQIKKQKNENIILIYSTVTLIGYDAKGENKLQYRVSQDKNGKIKTVSLLQK